MATSTHVEHTLTPLSLRKHDTFFALRLQTLDMQWTYDVLGTAPEYKAPVAQSTILASLGGRYTKHTRKPRVNFVKNNLKIVATAVSSPVKGAPLTVKLT